MRILIATGIYPPEVGGPAYYALSLADAFKDSGHDVRVATYGCLKRLPTGLRHLVFFFRFFFSAWRADGVLALDTFSVGLPSALWRVCARTPLVIRTGGDFLWEQYVERTGEKILFSNFYNERRNFTLKEDAISKLTGWILQRADRVVFSTEYQRDVFVPAYNLTHAKTALIENYYGEKVASEEPTKKNFVCFTRQLKWKNLDVLERAFARAKARVSDITLEIGEVSREQLLEKLKNAWAVVLVSLGDISPNFILEALQHNRPVLLTSENGLLGRIGNAVELVDPLDEEGIAEQIVSLADSKTRDALTERVQSFNFRHTYQDIAAEFISLFNTL